MAHELTAKQRRFADEYLVDLNATQAAIRAGYSQRSAYSTGQRMLKNAEVAAYVAERQQAVSAATMVRTADLVRELAHIAYGNLAEIAPWDETGPHLIPSAELAPEKQRLVASIKVKRERQLRGDMDDPQEWEVEYMEIKREDRLSAIDKLLRVLGAYPKEKPEEIPGSQTLNILNVFGSMPREQVEALAQRYAGSPR